MNRWVRRAFAPASVLCATVIGAGDAEAQIRPFVLDTLTVAVDSRLGVGAGAVEVLDAETLARLPVRTVAEALQWGIGVDLQPRSAAQADLSIRGSTFEQVLVLVDGVRMSDPQTGHFDLDLAIPLERIERIEILRGPASAVFGADAFGGVVHVVTKDGRGQLRPEAAIRLEGGTDQAFGVAIDGVVPAGSWSLMGGASSDVSDGHREGTDYRVSRMSGRATGPLAAGRAVLDVGRAMRDFGAADFYAPFPSYEETRTTTGALRWIGNVSDVTLEPRVSVRRHEDDFVLRRGDPGFYRNLHDSRRVSAEVQARMPVGSHGALSVGAEWTRETLESTNLGDREQAGRAGWVELALRRRGVELQAGARYDDRDDVGSFLSPTASVRWDGLKGAGLRASWGRTFRAPTWTERYYVDPANVGTPDLAVERGWSAEATAELRRDWGIASVTAFQRRAEDLIDWARPEGSDASVPWETRNVEAATYRGVELAVRGFTLGSTTLQGSASWLRLETEEETGFFSKYALRPIHRELTLGARTPLPGESVLVLRAADRRRLGAGGGLTVDTRLELPVGPGTAYVDVLNLTDASHVDVSGFPIPGRRFMVGVRSSFGG